MPAGADPVPMHRQDWALLVLLSVLWGGSFFFNGVALRELPTGIVLGSILGVIGIVRITLWQTMGLFDYGPHWVLVAATVGTALVGIVTFGSLCGSMLPFILKRIGFDPASASAPFVATLVDVTGLVIYFGVAAVILRGTLL